MVVELFVIIYKISTNNLAIFDNNLAFLYKNEAKIDNLLM